MKKTVLSAWGVWVMCLCLLLPLCAYGEGTDPLQLPADTPQGEPVSPADSGGPLDQEAPPRQDQQADQAPPTEVPRSDAYTRAEVLPYMQSMPAPTFSLYNSTGEMVSLADQKGRIVLLHFWTTWDPESLKGLQQCGRVANAYQDITVWAVNSLPREYGRDWITDADRVQMENWAIGFLSENRLAFDILLDLDDAVTGLYAADLPAFFFIDRDGTLRIPWQGTLSEQTTQTLLEMMYALDAD